VKQLMFSLIIAVFAALLLPFLADAQRAARSVWPKKDGVYLAKSSETIPPFPRTLSGYRATGNLDYWDNPLPFTLHGSVRIHQGFGWQGISDDFPMTMNHCSAGAFMLRWRSDNPDVLISSMLADEINYRYPFPGNTVQTGRFGYMQGFNCVQPAFKFSRAINGNKSNLVDIYYELEFWRASP
jgi:hypothetical protein